MEQWQALGIRGCFGLGIHMEKRVVFSAARFRRMGHGAEDVSREARDGGRRISNVLALLQLDLVAVFNEFLARTFLVVALGVFEDGPEIGNTENDIGTDEGFLQRLDIVDVAFDDLDTFGRPLLGTYRLRIAGHATNFPTGGVKIRLGNRASLYVVASGRGKNLGAIQPVFNRIDNWGLPVRR